MPMCQKFLVQELDCFDPVNYRQLESSLEKIASQQNTAVGGRQGEMLLSFVKDHSMKPGHVREHPALASLISTKPVPPALLKDLFESGRNRLEWFIQAYFSKHAIQKIL